MSDDSVQVSAQFQTQNAQLAAALLDVGCELARQDEGGPAENLYTIGWLRDKKIGVGKPIEKAVEEAVARKIAGTVTYIFKRSALLERSILVWDLMVEEMQIAEHEGRPPVMPVISDEHIIQCAYIHALNRRNFLELPWFNEPLVSTVGVKSRRAIPVEGKPGPKTIATGSGKVWRLGSKQSIKDHLNI